MGIRSHSHSHSHTSLLFLLLVFNIIFPTLNGRTVENNWNSTSSGSLNRNSFPNGFLFGTASSAYQYEGGANEGGRGPSIWDNFTQRYPHGTLKGGVNKVGIKYYNDLINEVISKGLQPFVTLFHWDLPQGLEDAYGGFLSPKIVGDFKDYSELCFKEFGDRVKNWITLNEPFSFITHGYDSGTFAPGRCSPLYAANNCSGGDSSTEPYLVAHNQLLAHAAAVGIYRTKYKSQKGQIGISLNGAWMVPINNSIANKEGANRALAFTYGWFMEPLKSGNYPSVMVKYVQERLPKFTKEESSMVKGSFDFIGLNYYSAKYAENATCSDELGLRFSTDYCVDLTFDRNNIPIGPMAASPWLYSYPKGMENIVMYTVKKLNNPVIYITENGYSELNTGNFSKHDNTRIKYFVDHLSSLQKAIKRGANVKGYFAWSLLDNFEWADGYTIRFGIVYVDYKRGLTRRLKDSATWFKQLLHH
ncbi:beta-glucosidase 12-like isoform X2 [Humulus lupulus]|uniref:beta-glucosidase 12-like isoform X2 n=1 Tax=Humulus lupulus TaxID=3486 RepID=UPI002B418279|nr:beta-glucosidase 12-like isoform X2 [Humulus lupulus]